MTRMFLLAGVAIMALTSQTYAQGCSACIADEEAAYCPMGGFNGPGRCNPQLDPGNGSSVAGRQAAQGALGLGAAGAAAMGYSGAAAAMGAAAAGVDGVSNAADSGAMGDGAYGAAAANGGGSPGN